MSLNSEQRSYIVQNMSKMGDDELARDLNIDEKLVKDFVVTVNDICGHLKEEVKSYQLKYTTLIVELINGLDCSAILTLPKFESVSKRELIVESLMNFMEACRAGQFSDILLESLKRGSTIDEHYLYVYNKMKDYVERQKNNEEIVSPLVVFNRNSL